MQLHGKSRGQGAEWAQEKLLQGLRILRQSWLATGVKAAREHGRWQIKLTGSPQMQREPGMEGAVH